jgi:hypothetical protein
MISWSRLLAGKWRDPQVASAALAGTLVGISATLLVYAQPLLQRAFGAAERWPFAGMDVDLTVLAGTGSAVGFFFGIVVDVTRESLMIFVALVVLRLLLRGELRTGLAAVVIWSLVWHEQAPGGAWQQALCIGMTFLTACLVIGSLITLGLLTLVVGYVAFALILSYPIRPDVTLWYSTVTLLPSLALLLSLGAALVILRERARRRPASA